LTAVDPEARKRPWRPWLRGTPGLTMVALFALVAAALLFGTYLIFSSVRAERAVRIQVAHTAGVIDALRDIGLATVNAETGQRGYLLTLDRRYLASYQLGAAAYPEAVRRLHRLLDPQATAEQQALLTRAEKLADSKFSEMAESVSLVDDGRLLDAKSRLLSDEGQDLMVELRATLGELERSESRALALAAEDATRIEGRMLPLLGWLAVLIVVALALGVWLVARTTRAEVAAAKPGALAETRDRADLLARELNHPVKNLFSVVLAIVKLSGKGEPEAKPVVDKISRRINALIKAHESTQGVTSQAVADLRELVETAIAPYRSDAAQCQLDGERVPLKAKAALPLGLVLHELVTNAVKYGAWSKTGGTLRIEWRREDGRIRLVWREHCDAPVAERQQDGFGSMLMTSSARQLSGTIKRTFHSDGVEVRIDFPEA
jgi:two-component sensor histidine kinase